MNGGARGQSRGLDAVQAEGCGHAKYSSLESASSRLAQETVRQGNERTKPPVINAAGNSNRRARQIVPEKLDLDVVRGATGGANLINLDALIPNELSKL